MSRRHDRPLSARGDDRLRFGLHPTERRNKQERLLAWGRTPYSRPDASFDSTSNRWRAERTLARTPSSKHAGKPIHHAWSQLLPHCPPSNGLQDTLGSSFVGTPSHWGHRYRPVRLAGPSLANYDYAPHALAQSHQPSGECNGCDRHFSACPLSQEIFLVS